MENQPAASNSPHPLIWIAGVALIIFSVVGIAAFMGWIPSSVVGPGGARVTWSMHSGAIQPNA